MNTFGRENHGVESDAVRHRLTTSLICAAIGFAVLGCHRKDLLTAIPRNADPEERAIMQFNVDGIGIGSRPTDLKVFSQIAKLPAAEGQPLVYVVTSPKPHISMLLAWFESDRLVRMEVRYFGGPGVTALMEAGGWVGILDYLEAKLGPPSEFGPEVKVVATLGNLSGTGANFNGAWIFSRVNRQLNYIAMADGHGAASVVTVMRIDGKEVSGLPVPRKKRKPKSGDQTASDVATLNPGFQFSIPKAQPRKAGGAAANP